MAVEDAATPPPAVVVTGAGHDAANGLFVPTGKVWHDAPVFENDRRCLLSREPHRNQRTGQLEYGWILGQDRKALYIVQSSEVLPPASGWKRHGGQQPSPAFQVLPGVPEAAEAAGAAWKEAGNRLFAARRYEEALTQWTRALGFLKSAADADLEAVIHANLAEGRLRLQQYEAALESAQAALVLKPGYEKAMLRGAVAAKELRRLEVGQDLLRGCLEKNPEQGEARQLLLDVERLLDEEGSKNVQGRAKSARAKLQESIRQEAEEGDLSRIPRAFAAKDQNSKKGLQAFEGYAQTRAPAAERPALDSLPYHHMGLPAEQVAKMDEFFREMREEKDEKARRARQDEEECRALRAEYRQQAGQEGSAKPQAQGQVEEPAAPSRGYNRASQEKGRAALPQEVASQIDKLFDGAPVQPEVTPPGALRDRRTARERQLDEEEAEQRRQRDDRVLQEIRRLQGRTGEPTRLEQAGSEVYCWWTIPQEVGGRDVKVEAKQGGAWLTVSVRGVVIFDAALFDSVRTNDLVWSVDDGELHITLTKAERNKLWEQLAQVGEVQHDANGGVLPESLPAPLSSSDRIAKFNEMLTGDDGVEFNYEELDDRGRCLVDALRKYRHARATGDEGELAEAEVELEEFGRLVI